MLFGAVFFGAVFFGAVFFGAVFLGGCGSGDPPVPGGGPGTPDPGPAPARVVDRTPGTAVARDLRDGESHTYRIALEAGERVHLVVEQHGADVVCELSDPQGELLLKADSMGGAWGPEDLFWIVQETGEFHLLIRETRLEAAGRYTLTVRELGPARDDDRRRAAAARQFHSAESLRKAGRYAQAIALHEKALAAYRELADGAGEAQVLHRLGVLRGRQQEWRAARRYFELAVPLFKAAGNARMVSVGLLQIGRSHYYTGEIESALPFYRDALRIRMELGDRHWQAYALNNLGNAQAVLGQFQEALALYDQALERWRESGARVEEANTLHARGRCYMYLGQFQQAQDDLNHALEIREELGNRRGQESTLRALGILYEALALHRDRNDEVRSGMLQESLSFLQRAITVRGESGSRMGHAVTLSVMGRVYSGLQQKSLALESFTQAREIFRELGDRPQEAFVLYGMGSYLLSIGQAGRALDYLREALPLLESTGRQHEIDALAKIASAQRRQGDLLAALEYIDMAVAKTEALRTNPASPELRSSLFALRQNHYETYIEILMELHRKDEGSGYDARALTVSERARARSLLEALIESGADLRRGADPALLARERSLEEAINSKELQRLRFLDGDVNVPQAASVEREIRRLLREYKQVRARIRLSSPTYTALTQPSPLAVDEIQRQVLSDGALLLQYKLGWEHSYVWVVDRDSIASFQLPGRDTVESLARRLYSLLEVSNRRESRLPIQEALSELSDVLIRPVAPLLQGRRLLIVSDGALQYIPFGALPLPAPEAETPLVVAHEITYMPSASTLAELRRRLAGRPPAPGRVAVVADPVFQSHDPRFHRGGRAVAAAASSRDAVDLRRFERLVFSEQEARAIFELVPEHRRYQALGFAANRETVLSGALGRYQIIHFATHGYVDEEQPELSRLVLSLLDESRQQRNGFLFAHEIYNLELPAELVVLSACRTALGTRVRGEGLVGLTQAFMYAGAARILVSLWPVNDEATAELMARFYRHLLRDEAAPADALRRAQLSISREPRWQAPYYWAGFVLQGEW